MSKEVLNLTLDFIVDKDCEAKATIKMANTDMPDSLSAFVTFALPELPDIINNLYDRLLPEDESITRLSWTTDPDEKDLEECKYRIKLSIEEVADAK